MARTLLATYPTAGLESLPQLADGAGVTGPTVLRFVRKIGFEGYPDFQRSLRARGAGAHRGAAVALPDEGRDPGRRGRSAGARRRSRARSTRRSRRARSRTTSRSVVALLADREASRLVRGRPVQPARRDATCACSCACCGPGCAMVGESPERRVLDSLEVSRRDVLCLFDYRRYQQDTIAAGKVAAERGAVVVVFTDPWLSPAVEYGAARADLARGFGVAVRLVARGVRADRADRGEGRGGARRRRAGRGSASWRPTHERMHDRPVARGRATGTGARRDEPARHEPTAPPMRPGSQAWLEEAGVAAVVLGFVDPSAIVRAKMRADRAVRRRSPSRASGCPRCSTWRCRTIGSRCSPGYIDGPSGDLRLRPDPGATVPLAAMPGWAWAPVDQYTQDGEPFAACPRAFARRMADAFTRAGSARCKAVFEFEFSVGTPTR